MSDYVPIDQMVPYYGSRASPHFESLPVELVLHIVEYLSSDSPAELVQKSLLALSRVSPRLHVIVTPYLFRHNVQRMESSGFRLAVWLRNRHAIKTLLEYGGDITTRESGPAMLIAIDKRPGDVETLKFLVDNAPEDAVTTALSQDVDHKRNKLLHWAVYFADIPCVKVLLEAGAKMGAMNQEEERTIENVFAQAQSGLESRYNELVRIFLDQEPGGEMFEPIRSDGRTTLLIAAAKRASLESVIAILEDGEEYCEEEDFDFFVNQICTHNSWTALGAICYPSNWPGGPEGRNKVRAIVDALLEAGIDVNTTEDVLDTREGLPLYRICYKPPLVDDPYQRLETIRLQHEILSLLLEHGAVVGVPPPVNDRHTEGDYHPCMKFLDTAEYYSIYILDPGDVFLKPEDILRDAHPSLRFDTVSPSRMFDAEEKEEKDEILRLMQDMFRLLVKNMTKENLSAWSRVSESITILHRAATVRGIFGVWATQMLLEEGVSVDCRGRYNQTPLSYAQEKGLNKCSISLLRRWRKTIGP